MYYSSGDDILDEESIVIVFLATLRQATTYAAAISASIVTIGFLSPAGAAERQDTVSVFPDILASDNNHGGISVPDRNCAMALTSRLPWRAPIGHRQPLQADVPQDESISAWERQQDRLNRELDRKLMICRGC
ncbi:MAG TPA: hypothetical protein VFH89_02490 [Sphingomicrobium sp.]|nr:hypothetical protein [Sphingomicrobium sp.]